MLLEVERPVCVIRGQRGEGWNRTFFAPRKRAGEGTGGTNFVELEKLRKVLEDTRNEFYADKRLVAVGAWKEIS